MKKEAEEIDELLEESVRNKIGSRDEVGIIYSGGIDSTLVALKAQNYAKVKCYTVGFQDAPDYEYALDTAEYGLEVTGIPLDMDSLEGVLKEVVDIVKDPHPLTVGVGVPMYLASKKAAEDGLKVMLCGQGADELFGGYHRYLRTLVGEGKEAVLQDMICDVESADEDNLDRDRKVTRENGIDLRFPFLREELIEYVLDLPLEHRIREVDEDFDRYGCVDEYEDRYFVRKYILREVAEENDVPPKVVNRKKRAAQYGSRVHRNLDRLARRKGFKKKARQKGLKHYQSMYLKSLMKEH